MTTETTNPDEYNGWKNFETWALNLWLSNDQGMYLATQEIAGDATDGYVSSCETYGFEPTDSGRAHAIGTAILEWFDDDLREWMEPGDYAAMRDDIGSLWRVDEQELGAAWIEEE